MSGQILIYGATGYTGKLVAKAAADAGAPAILAGRSLDKTKAVAGPLGLEARAFDLGGPARIDAGLKGVAAVLCIAGPFSATSRPMVDACLRNGVHYLDITGEIDVFEAVHGRDAEAKAKGVTLLPGAGFDVVPTDCLAAHLKRRLPDATALTLYLSIGANMSRGTAKSMVEGIPGGMRMRRGGRIVSRPRAEMGRCDFGEGEKDTVEVPWGDVATAYYSTGIPDVTVHFAATRALASVARMPAPMRALLGLGLVQRILKAQADRLPEGPSESARLAGRTALVGEARNARGDAVRTRIRGPEGYTLTALTALDAAKRVAAGEAAPGFQTPSLAFGPDYILGFPGVTREDLNR